MAFFKHDNIDFYYEDDANSGIPFIFLHGLGGSTEQTAGLMKATPGIRRIVIDFRGHGRTRYFGDKSMLSFNQFADDVKALIDFLKLEKFYLGGISTGAGVSLNFALRHPENMERLILSRPAWEDCPQPEMIQKAFQEVYQILNDSAITDKKSAYKQKEIYQTMNQLSSYAGETLLGQFDYPYATETSLKLVCIPTDCPNSDRDEWKKLNIPTLILGSHLDPLHPYEYGELLHKYIPHSEFKQITSKTVSGKLHATESYEAIQSFLINKY
ncbi:alpha/beta fold hydrolase [Enterococcus sp. AZ103]|uniref:alpha/beta fold hydrolase n=1 Tax=Enterococcus sp. AZ103 TaxID=2774628 RepID=UPI003F2130FD